MAKKKATNKTKKTTKSANKKVAAESKIEEPEKIKKIDKQEEPKITHIPEEAKQEHPKKTNQKTRKGWTIGVILAIIVAIIGITIGLMCTSKNDPSDPRAELDYSESFFIYDGGKYTLWNKEGERLTDDEYYSQSNFVAGYAYVKKGDQYGIVKDDGRMSVDYGKYGSITNKGGLYLVQDGNTKEYQLITGENKVLEKGSELDVYTASTSGGFAAVKAGSKIRLYGHNGTLIAELNETESANEPELDDSYDFGLLNYNNQNIVFDAREEKVIGSFEGQSYQFDTVTEKRDKILLKNNEEAGKYKLLVGNKIYDLDETKYYAMSDYGVVVGYDNYSEIALLGDDYKVIRRVGDYLELKDSYNFAVENDNGVVEIYHNGELAKTFGDDSGISDSSVLFENYYAITENDRAKFYNLDGSVAFDHEYYDIYSTFDKYQHAIVADVEGEYYPIDLSWNRIGDYTVENISLRNGGYEIANAENKYAIANKKAMPITDFKYTDTQYRRNAEPNNIWTGCNNSEDTSHDVIDGETGEVILKDVDVQSFYANYFTVKNKEGKTDYYTYKGKLFYTSEK